jgi:DNA-binding protein HU-beta
MPVIRIGGAKSSTTSSKSKTLAKPAGTKATTTKRTTASKAKTTTARAKTATTAAKSNGGAPRGPRATPKEFKDFERQLTRAGEKSRKTREAHDEATDELAALVAEAKKANVPMSIMERATGLKRQWLYKINNTAKRTNGNGSGSKTAAKRAVKSATTARKPAAKKPAAKTGSRRIKVAGK